MTISAIVTRSKGTKKPGLKVKGLHEAERGLSLRAKGFFFQEAKRGAGVKSSELVFESRRGNPGSRGGPELCVYSVRFVSALYISWTKLL